MAKQTDKLIDKLKLENLNFKNLKKIIDLEPSLAQEWSLRDQLDAIDLLGYTASREALVYLQKVYQPSILVKQRIDWRTLDGVTKKETNLVQQYNYQNAAGPLAHALRYEISLFKSTKHHLKRLKPSDEIKKEQQAICGAVPAHVIVRKALDRLQRSIFLHQIE